jgi:hypothetical protein
MALNTVRLQLTRFEGACQEDIFYHYKLALHRAYAEDAVAYENDERIKDNKSIYTPEEYEERIGWHLSRTPYKLTKCRYHSFQHYFHWLKQLEWVEFIGKEEASSLQEQYAPAPPRRYYRFTRDGIEAPDWQWSNPLITCPPEIAGMPALEYFEGKRKQHLYVNRSPTKSRRRST